MPHGSQTGGQPRGSQTGSQSRSRGGTRTGHRPRIVVRYVPVRHDVLDPAAATYTVRTVALHFSQLAGSSNVIQVDRARSPVTTEDWHNVIFRSITGDRFDFILVKVPAMNVKGVLRKQVELDGVRYRVDLMSGSLFKPDEQDRRTLIGIPEEAGRFFAKLLSFEESIYYASRALFSRHIAGVQGLIRGRAYPLLEEHPPIIKLTHRTTGREVSIMVHDGWGYLRQGVAREMASKGLARPMRRHKPGGNANYQMFQWFKEERPEVLSELASSARLQLAPSSSRKARYSALTTGRPAMQLGVAMPTPGSCVVFPSGQRRFEAAAQGGVILSRSPADKPNCYPVHWDEVECAGATSDFLAGMECLQYTWMGRDKGHLTFFKGMLGIIPDDWWPAEWKDLSVIVCSKDRKLDERWRAAKDRDAAHVRQEDFSIEGSLVAVDWFAAGEAVGVPYAIQSWLGGDYDGDEVQVLFEKHNPHLFRQVVDEFDPKAVNPKLDKRFSHAPGRTRRNRLMAMATKNTERWSVIAAAVNALPVDRRRELASSLGVKGETELFLTIERGIKVGTDSYKTSEDVSAWEKLASRYEKVLRERFGKGPLPYSKALMGLLEHTGTPVLTDPAWRGIYFQCVNTYPLPPLKGTMPLRGVPVGVLGRVIHRLLPKEQKTLVALKGFFEQWLRDHSITEESARNVASSTRVTEMLEKLLKDFSEEDTGRGKSRASFVPRPATRGRGGWKGHLENVQGYVPRTEGVLNVLDVLYMLSGSDVDGAPASFWQAYHVFVQEHPQYRYSLSPVDVMRWKKGISPTGLYIMAGAEEWAEYERFKRQHPQFEYSH